MAPLPEARVKPAPPFSVTGCDHGGPLYCCDKPGKKLYILLFTCAVTRALHLELMDSLSGEMTFMTIRRLIARRGMSSIIMSDNAKGFKSASESLLRTFGSDVPRWRFIAPLSPWWGGCWERLMGSVKQALRKTIGKRCLTVVGLETNLQEVEMVLNSRPLTFVGDSFAEEEVLTLAHFLIGRTLKLSTSLAIQTVCGPEAGTEGKAQGRLAPGRNGVDDHGDEGSISIWSFDVTGILAYLMSFAITATFIWIFCFKDIKMKIPLTSVGESVEHGKRRSILKKGPGDYIPVVSKEPSDTNKNVIFTWNPGTKVSLENSDSNRHDNLSNCWNHRKIPSHKSVSFCQEIDPLTSVSIMVKDKQETSLGEKSKRRSNTTNRKNFIHSCQNESTGDRESKVNFEHDWQYDKSIESPRQSATFLQCDLTERSSPVYPKPTRRHSSFRSKSYNTLEHEDRDPKKSQAVTEDSLCETSSGMSSGSQSPLEIERKPIPEDAPSSFQITSDLSTMLKISKVSPPPDGYHVREDFSNVGPMAYIAGIHCEDLDLGGNSHRHRPKSLDENLKTNKHHHCGNLADGIKMHYRLKKIGPKKPQGQTGSFWSQLASNAVLYEYVPQLPTHSSLKGPRNNSNQIKGRKNRTHASNNKSPLGTCRFKSRLNDSSHNANTLSDISQLNRNANAQYSDTDLRENACRDKKHDNMSSASGASVVSADVFFSTKTDVPYGCEANQSLMLLAEKSFNDICPDSIAKEEIKPCCNLAEATKDKVNHKPASKMFEILGDLESKTSKGKAEPKRGGDQKNHDNISGRTDTLQDELNSKHSEDECRHNKKTHKPQNYAYLFPTSNVTEKASDVIDSVVMDCMRNALNEEIGQIQKNESEKLTDTHENQHRLSSQSNRKKCIPDASVAKLKYGSRKSLSKNARDEVGNTGEESSPILQKTAISKDIISHRNLKSTSISTPNLLSSIELCNQQPQALSIEPGIMKCETSSPEHTPKHSIRVKTYGMEVSPHKKYEQPNCGYNKEAVVVGNDNDGAITEITTDGDVGDADKCDIAFSTNNLPKAGKILKLNGNEIALDEMNMPLDTKNGKKIVRRGRSPRKKKLPEVSVPVKELASILSTSKENERSLVSDDNDDSRETEANKRRRTLGRLKKSVSLSPRCSTHSKRMISFPDDHQSASHGNIADLTKKLKLKIPKKPAKKKRVRIALMHDDSPVIRRLKVQNNSPMQDPVGIPPAEVAQQIQLPIEIVHDEKKKHSRKPSKMLVRKRPPSNNKVQPHENETQNTPTQIMEEKDTPKAVQPDSDSHEPIYVPQCPAERDSDTQAQAEVVNHQASPIQESTSQTEVSDKSMKLKTVATKPKPGKKESKQEKDLQNAETGWNNSVNKNLGISADRAKSAKPKNVRKMYKLVKQTNKGSKSKSKGNSFARNADDDKGDVERLEHEDEIRYSEPATAVGKENALQQKKAHTMAARREAKVNDSQQTAHFSRRQLSPRVAQGQRVGTQEIAAVFKEDKSIFGSSVDKRELDEGSSVDAPGFHTKGLHLRQTKSGPALGVGKYASKETDAAAKRVKFARENAMNYAKQSCKGLVNQGSPCTARPSFSPQKDVADKGKAGQKTADEQSSPVSCRSTDLDQAAGFRRPRSPLRATMSGRHPRTGYNKPTPKSAPKVDIRIQDCSCSLTNSQGSTQQFVPTCDNSMDYNVLNLGLNWMVQGVINSIPFLRPTSEHTVSCPGTTAAGDTRHPQTLSSTSVNH